MMTLKEKINDYLLQLNFSEDDIAQLDASSVYVAQQIALYAHRNQSRLNGDNYYVHPYNVLSLYRKFTGITDDYFCVDLDLLVWECGIPYDGVQEVCLLHDVLEDTDVTLEQIESVFVQLSLDKYFNMYIKEPLLLVTHDKKEDYPTYIAKLLANPVASIVKFMDMADNMNTTGLVQLGDFELARIEKYAHFSKVINDKWHFLERCRKYKQLYNMQQ